MKRLYTFAMALATCILSNVAIAQNPASLPRTIESGPFKAGHIQGIAVDTDQKYIYYSYTTMLIKTDMQGNIVGTVTGLLGHLGDLDFNDEDGRLYGSLEYKNDAIGQGILRMERSTRTLQNAFYIAIFDVERITRVGMDAEKDDIMTTVYLPTVLEDYLAEVVSEEGKQKHRLGCSGIDGVTFGPKFGKSGGKQYLTGGYGVYGETERSDNDYQVLLQYDISKWKKYEHKLSQDDMHQQGPAKPSGEYFVKTGNTTYGVQNLDYDPSTNLWMMAVYAGRVLGLDYNSTLLVANVAALISYIPVGIISSKFGRKKTIIAGVIMLSGAFLTAAFLDAGTPLPVMMILFSVAGIGWATINVNSFPMVVELARGGNVGKYTGFYYTASMAAPTLTPLFSGFLMDTFGLKILFPYAAVFSGLAILTMALVRHGDVKIEK